MSIKSVLSAVAFFTLSNTDALNLRSVIPNANTNYLNNSVSSIDSLSNIPINCTNTNYLSPECGYRGICLPNGACKCDENYVTFPRNHPLSNVIMKRRKQVPCFGYHYWLVMFQVQDIGMLDMMRWQLLK